jgi:succinoglycan biosynthesis transport protein ExoP
VAISEQAMENDGLERLSPYSPRGLLQIAWQRNPLVALGIAVGLVLAALYYAQTTPLYQSKAQVLVVKKRLELSGVDTKNLAMEDYVATHQTLLRSPIIIEKAIQKRNLAALESVQGQEDLTEFLIKALTVSRNRTAGINSSNVLDLAFRGKKASECVTILNAVMESYKDFLDETYRSTSEDTLKLVTEARDVLQKSLNEQELAYRKFRKETPLLMLRGTKEGGANLAQERLSNIEFKRTALAIRKVEVQSILATLESGIKKGTSRESLLATISEWSQKLEGESARYNQPLTLQNQLYPLLMDEQRLLETKGSNHPEVQAIRQRIEITRSFLASPLGPWQDPADLIGKKEVQAGKPLEFFQQYLKQQLHQIEMSEGLLAELFKEEYDRAKSLTSFEIEDEGFRTDIARSQKLYDSIIKRLQDIDLVKDGGYDAKTISPPVLGKKVHPSGLIIFPAALFLGALGGFGLAYLAEMLDQGFHSVEEVRQRLGLPVVGFISSLKETQDVSTSTHINGRALDPNLCTYFHPKSVEAEGFRGVRTALFFNTRGGGHKVIQVTSPNAGDGKSNLAANLAISIAQSGKKVILVDADLRKPRVHKIFDFSASVGLASVIAGETELKEAFQDSGIPGLSILPCGPLPHNPAELLTSPHFKELLDALKDQFDFVIVDTPPLLHVSDPSVVAPRVDGVLLTIRFSKHCRPHAERAKDILKTLGVNVLGVVINDPEQRTNKKGYGYDSYYGYGNGEAEVEESASEVEESFSKNGDAVSPSNF